jgi:formylglycine-generating enzyme required for sulfatase activity
MKSVNGGNPNGPPPNPDHERWVWINPGTFTMGSPNGEADRLSNEGPQIQVTLSQGFWMSKHETTQAEYRLVMGTDPSFSKADANLPAETVSWDDATDYCGK